MLSLQNIRGLKRITRLFKNLIFMFKIKVGLKSFQTHSMQKCKHQIGGIISYLKQSRTSLSVAWEKGVDRAIPLPPKEHTATSLPQKTTPRLHSPAVKEVSRSSKLQPKPSLSQQRLKEKNNRVEALFKTVPLPTLVKKITTLRSPHIDKKSREQFEWKREKAQISFNLGSVEQICFVLFVLTHSRFPGVEIEVCVESKTYFA